MTEKSTYKELEKRIQELERAESVFKKTEEAAKLSSQYTRGLIETDLDALVTISSKGKITDTNKASELITGISRTEIIGTNFSNYFTVPDAAHKGFQQVFRDGYVKDYPLEIKHRDGRIIPVLYNASVYKDSQGSVVGVFAAARDITERKKARELLEKKVKKNTFDLEKRIKELSCLYSISKLSETKNLKLDHLLQSTVDILPSGFQHPDITCAEICVADTTFETKLFVKTKWKLSSPIYLKKKKLGHIEIFYTKKISTLDEDPFLREERDLINSICEKIGSLIGKIQAEKVLKEIETRYQILTDLFADGVAIIQKDVYKFTNKAFSKMAACTSPKKLIGKKCHQFVSKDFLELYRKANLIEPDTSNFQDTLEYKFLPESGKEIWVEEKRNIIYWASAPALLCTLRDITETKKTETLHTEETKRLRRENILLRSSLKERCHFQNIIGNSPIMQQVYDQILTAANSDANVSIYGESGTGKELVAKAIHNLSNRDAKAFIAINCGAIPESLWESEFFGYKKGAFTGAVIDKHGFLDLADKGTVFLDEVAELLPSMQVKLLRAIDGSGYNPIGSNKVHTSDFRIIAATNKNLKDEVVKGDIREDFYYRIQVILIKLPPLRERKEDIPLLVEHFTRMYSKGSQFSKVPDHIIST